MDVIRSILTNPAAWTGERVLRELPLRAPEDLDQPLPAWLRALLDVAEFDTQVQMEGLLGWWEDHTAEEVDRVIDGFESIGLPDQAELLRRAREAIPPESLVARPVGEYTLSTFVERQSAVTEAQYDAFADLEARLYLHAPDGPDLYDALVRHADRGLATGGSGA